MGRVSYDELLVKGDMESFIAKAIDEVKYKTVGKQFAGMETDDVVQEVIVELYKSIKNYDSTRAKASTFVSSVINNQIKQCYRRAGAKYNLMVSNAWSLGSESVRDCHEMCEEKVTLGKEDESYNLFELTYDILDTKRLTKQELSVLKMSYDGYSSVEISKMLGCGKSRITAIKKSIQDKMKKLTKGE